MAITAIGLRWSKGQAKSVLPVSSGAEGAVLQNITLYND